MAQPTPTAMSRLPVGSGDLDIAAWQGPRTGPTLVFVHGFPDTHAVWQPVIDRLADRFHCIAYDVRGAGASGAPPSREGYELAHLLTDLVAVLDTLDSDEPVHLVGHDWGSIQLWEAVFAEPSDPRLKGRVASYTSISGPALGHVAAFYHSAGSGAWTDRRAATGQLLRSWYALAFQLPFVPDVVMGWYAGRLLRRNPSPRVSPTLRRDAVNGLELYRANLFKRSSRDGLREPARLRTDLPVQLLVALRDAFVGPALARTPGRFMPQMREVEIDAGHWAPVTHPDDVAAAIAGHVCAHPVIGEPGVER